jgi:hypothetical protein
MDTETSLKELIKYSSLEELKDGINIYDNKEYLKMIYYYLDKKYEYRRDILMEIANILIDKLFTDTNFRELLRIVIQEPNNYQLFNEMIYYENIPIKFESKFEGKDIESYVIRPKIVPPNIDNVLISSFHGSLGTRISELPQNIYLIQPKCCGNPLLGRIEEGDIIKKITEGIDKNAFTLFEQPFIVFKPGSYYCDINLDLIQTDHVRPGLYKFECEDDDDIYNCFDSLSSIEKQKKILNNFSSIIDLILDENPGHNILTLPYIKDKVSSLVSQINQNSDLNKEINITQKIIRENLNLKKYFKDYLYLLNKSNQDYLEEIYEKDIFETSLSDIINKISRKKKDEITYLISVSCQSLYSSNQICHITKCMELYKKKEEIDDIETLERNLIGNNPYFWGDEPLKNYQLFLENLKNPEFLELYKNKIKRYEKSINDCPAGHFLLSLLDDGYKFYVDEGYRYFFIQEKVYEQNILEFIAFMIVLIVFYDEKITPENYKYLQLSPFEEDIVEDFQNYINRLALIYFDKNKLDNNIYFEPLIELENIEPIIYAVSFNNLEMIKMLDSIGWNEEKVIKYYRNNRPSEIYNLLSVAVNTNNIEIIKKVYNLIKKLNVKKLEGIERIPYLLEYAEEKEVIEFLMANGCDINGNVRTGEKVLENAIKNYKKEKVLILLQNGVDVNFTNDNNETPLHLAVKNRFYSIVKALLRLNKIDLNIQNINGETVLHFAVLNRDVDMIKILLKFNINSNIKNNEGKTPLQLAKLNKDRKIIILLQGKVPKSGGNYYQKYLKYKKKYLELKNSNQLSN